MAHTGTTVGRIARHVDVERLDWEMARRGLTSTSLARVAGVSHPVIISLRNGRDVRADMLKRIGEGLAKTPVIPELDSLLPRPDPRTPEPHEQLSL